LENMVTDHAACGQGWSGHCISSYVGKYKVRGWGCTLLPPFLLPAGLADLPSSLLGLGKERFLFN
jgi:hypothetical protein